MLATHRHARVRSRRGPLAACALVVGLAGCFGLNPYVARRTAEHAYGARCEQVWPAVRAVLLDRDYEVTERPAVDGLALETAWRPVTPISHEGRSLHTVRYLARGDASDATGCRVSLTQQTNGIEGVTSRRDLELEWEVLRHVDPGAAREIEAAARRPAATRPPE